eukprot:528464-Amphidinium_carterae.2
MITATKVQLHLMQCTMHAEVAVITACEQRIDTNGTFSHELTMKNRQLYGAVHGYPAFYLDLATLPQEHEIFM